jgi:hypothetical protein
MPTFVLRLIAPRPNFAQTMTDAEREIMNRHAAHWRPYLERGDIVVFGLILTDDDSYGFAVVETDDEQALRDFAAQDPVVTTRHRGIRTRADGRAARPWTLTGASQNHAWCGWCLAWADWDGNLARPTHSDRSSKRAHGDEVVSTVRSNVKVTRIPCG